MTEISKYKAPVVSFDGHTSRRNTISSERSLSETIGASAKRHEQDEDERQCVRKFPSPISQLPKPLGLSYLNFHVHYHDLGSRDGTRNEAGARLMADILSHYFPRPRYRHYRLYPSNPLIESLPIEGLSYFVVRKADQDKAMDVAYRTEKFEKEDGQEDLASNGARQKSTSHPFTLLTVVVTAKSFLERPERKRPKVLKFHSSVQRADGGLVLSKDFTMPDNIYMDRGQVVILAGTPKPPSPTFEFYTFDGKAETNSTITPWFGRTKQQPEGYDKHSFPLTVEKAEIVDTMFNAITQSVDDPTVVIYETSASLQPPNLKETTPLLSRANTPASLKTRTTPKDRNPIGWLSDDFLRSLKLTKTGKLVGYQSQWLKKDLEIEARKQAEARGITFPTIQGKR